MWVMFWRDYLDWVFATPNHKNEDEQHYQFNKKNAANYTGTNLHYERGETYYS